MNSEDILGLGISIITRILLGISYLESFRQRQEKATILDRETRRITIKAPVEALVEKEVVNQIRSMDQLRKARNFTIQKIIYRSKRGLKLPRWKLKQTNYLKRP